jgi:hypothetical protein
MGIERQRRRVSRKFAVTMPSAKIRRLGERKSKKVCKREGCGRRITKLAEFYNDPYCSRVCMSIALNIPMADKGMHGGKAEND